MQSIKEFYVYVCACEYDLLLITQLGKPSPERFKSHPIFTMFASPCLADCNATLRDGVACSFKTSLLTQGIHYTAW